MPKRNDTAAAMQELVTAETDEERIRTLQFMLRWSADTHFRWRAWARHLEAALVQQCGSPEELRAALRWGGERPPTWAARMLGQVRRHFMSRAKRF